MMIMNMTKKMVAVYWKLESDGGKLVEIPGKKLDE